MPKLKYPSFYQFLRYLTLCNVNYKFSTEKEADFYGLEVSTEDFHKNNLVKHLPDKNIFISKDCINIFFKKPKNNKLCSH